MLTMLASMQQHNRRIFDFQQPNFIMLYQMFSVTGEYNVENKNNDVIVLHFFLSFLSFPFFFASLHHSDPFSPFLVPFFVLLILVLFRPLSLFLFIFPLFFLIPLHFFFFFISLSHSVKTINCCVYVKPVKQVISHWQTRKTEKL